MYGVRKVLNKNLIIVVGSKAVEKVQAKFWVENIVKFAFKM